MNKLNPFPLPSGHLSGDTFPIFRDGVCHLFHMMPPVIAHHVSCDLLHWEERPVVVAPGSPGEPDCHNNATGNVVEQDGRFYLFYTGNQNVCLAISDDLDHWVKHPTNPLVAGDDRLYASADFRDPFVFWNEEEARWWMLIGTRVTGVTAARGGCIGLAVSDDLLHWTLRPPLWAPGIGPHCDCPQLLRVEDRWHLLYLQRNTRCRVAPSPAGRFRRPPVRSLGTMQMAAGSRPAWDGRRWVSFPFLFGLQGEMDLGTPSYGGPLAIPRQLAFHRDGTVSERPVEEVLAAVRALPDPGDPLAQAQSLVGRWTILPRKAASTGPDGGTLLLPGIAADAYLEFSVCLETADSDFHLLLRTDAELRQGYQLALHPRTGQVSFRSISKWDTDRVLASRSVDLCPGRSISLRAFLCGSLLEVFIDDRVSLTCRVYDHVAGMPALELRDGAGVVDSICWRPLTKE